MRLLLSILLLAAATASAQSGTLTCSAGATVTVTCVGSTPTPPVTCTPPQVLQNGVCVDPAPTPPTPTGCAIPFSPPDRDWTPFEVSGLFPIPPTSSTGDVGRAIQFVADGVSYPNGVVLSVIDESGGNAAVGKDVMVSACPHDFTKPADPASTGCYRAGTTAFVLYLRYSTSPTPPKAYDCTLTSGKTYYINFRAYDHTSTAYSQFGAQAR